MINFLSRYKINFLLWLFILAYIVYFSYFSILRYKTLYASYYDLGIMNQTVYNTYRAIAEKNSSKILEMTDPVNGTQIKRMAIHNDLLLAPLALFYFIYPGPETLLVLQAIILGLGALAVFKIALFILQKQRYRDFIALVFAVDYLLYPALERANIFDFHGVTLATTFLLWMVYLWMEKKYVASFVFFAASLLSKEQVGFTTALFGLYVLLNSKFQIPQINSFGIFRGKPISKQIPKKKKNVVFSILVIVFSLLWVALSFLVIIPYFRGGNHFAVSRYGDFGDSPIRIIIGIIKSPYSVFRYVINLDTLNYLIILLGPLSFLSLLSPLQLVISLPEFAINLLSNSWGMKSIIYHYTAVITPFVFLSAIYGAQKILKINPLAGGQRSKIVIGILIVSSLLFTYFKGPLPFMKEQEIHPLKYPQQSMKEITLWAKTLKDTSIKISATGQIAPFFSSRQYLYVFSKHYNVADYVVVTLNEIYNYPEKDMLIPAFNTLQKDLMFKRIYKGDNVEVYKKI